MRTFSTDGTHSVMVFAMSTSWGFGMPKEIPSLATWWMALVTATGAWPRMFGPHEPM